MQPNHRKQIRSYNIPGDAHELTFSCFHRLPLLSKDRTQQWFVDAMRTTRERRHLHIWAYVIMPEHIHIIVHPQQPRYEVRLIRTGLKVPVQRRALRYLREHSPAFLEKLRDEQPNGDVHYRFWQRGGGYDRNITELTTLQQMIEYIHLNPVRRGLVTQATDWPWSSTRFYAGELDVPITMDPLPRLDR
jgi:putative transposase